MNQRMQSRMWIVAGAALLVLAGGLFLVAFLGRGLASPGPKTLPATEMLPASPVPAALPASQSPVASATPETRETEPETEAPVAAKVNGVPITLSYWQQSVVINHVLSELAGQPPLGQADTLDRLIKQELVLQAASPEQPTDEEVEGYIARMEEAWGVDDAAMVETLKAADLDRTVLVETIRRLLAVQRGAQSLQAEGRNVGEWLEEQQASSDVLIFEDVATPAAPSVEPVATEEATPTTSASATDAPASSSDIPDVAPDFTLERAGGGTFTLSEQLAEGPVVLVFFEKCG